MLVPQLQAPQLTMWTSCDKSCESWTWIPLWVLHSGLKVLVLASIYKDTPGEDAFASKVYYSHPPQHPLFQIRRTSLEDLRWTTFTLFSFTQRTSTISSSCTKGSFGWRWNRENRKKIKIKKRREKWEENVFSGCLVGRRSKKNWRGPSVFFTSPPKCFLPKLGRKHVRKCLD